MFWRKPDTADAFANERASHAKTVADLTKRLADRNVELIRERAAKHKIGAALSEKVDECARKDVALTEIAAMETKNPAPAAKKMAARARQELPANPGSAPVRAAMEAM